MPAAANTSAVTVKPAAQGPRPTAAATVLIVDDEPAVLELSSEILRRALGGARLVQAASLAEARRIIDREPIALMVADVQLPDGDGASLVRHLRQAQPTAAAIVMTGGATLEGSVSCFRDGALDYVSKPFTASDFAERVGRALRHQEAVARTERRLLRLRSAVRKLNTARRTVSKKVDLLCNDLVTAYGDLARQFEDVRVKENFRTTIRGAEDLEQMLCHTMDWLLRQVGYANIAIYLAGEEGEYELGAYMKYTLAGSKPLTDALRDGVVEHVARDEYVHWTDEDAAEQLTPAELDHLPRHGVLGANAAYLGESLATIVLFRDGKAPFTAEDAATLRAVAPIFANVLTTLAKREGDALADDEKADDEAADELDDAGDKPEASDGAWADEDESGEKPRDRRERPNPRENRRPRDERPRKKPDDADWWKRGEAPPF